MIPYGKYAFRYSASNAYGESELSPLQYVTPGDVPIVTGVPSFFTFGDFVAI